MVEDFCMDPRIDATEEPLTGPRAPVDCGSLLPLSTRLGPTLLFLQHAHPIFAMKFPALLLLAVILAVTPLHAGKTYVGLAGAAGFNDHVHSGLVAIHLNGTTTLSARIRWQGFEDSTAGAFGEDGVFRATVRKPGGSFAVEIRQPAMGTVSGSIIDRDIRATFVARPTGVPEIPEPAGRYNGVWQDNGALGFLIHSTFSAGVSEDRVRIIGKLNDGTPFSTGTWLVPGSEFELWTGVRVPAIQVPIYFGVYGFAKRGSVWGEMKIFNINPDFTPGFGRRFTQEINGSAQWFRPAQPAGPAPNMAGQSELSLYGNIYEITPESPWMIVPEVLEAPPQARLTLISLDGLFGATIPLMVHPGNTLSVDGSNPLRVQLFTVPEIGIFAGSFVHPPSGRRIHFSGLARPGGDGIGSYLNGRSLGSAIILGED